MSTIYLEYFNKSYLLGDIDDLYQYDYILQPFLDNNLIKKIIIQNNIIFSINDDVQYINFSNNNAIYKIPYHQNIMHNHYFDLFTLIFVCIAYEFLIIDDLNKYIQYEIHYSLNDDIYPLTHININFLDNDKSININIFNAIG